MKAPYGSQSTVLKGVGVEITNSLPESLTADSLVSEPEQFIRKINVKINKAGFILIVM